MARSIENTYEVKYVRDNYQYVYRTCQSTQTFLSKVHNDVGGTIREDLGLS